MIKRKGKQNIKEKRLGLEIIPINTEVQSNI